MLVILFHTQRTILHMLAIRLARPIETLLDFADYHLFFKDEKGDELCVSLLGRTGGGVLKT